MADLLQTGEIQVQALLLGRGLFLDDGAHFGLHAFRQVTVQRRPGAADQVLRQRVAPLREGQGHRDRTVLDVNIFHHPQRDQGLLPPRRVLHLFQASKNHFFRHCYFTFSRKKETR